MQVLEGEHERLGARAGEHPGDERRELAAAQFLGRKFRNAARRQRRVDHRREQRRIFGGVEPDRAERRLELGEALFAGDFGAAEAGAAPFRDRDAAACSATAARTPTRPRCAASPRAGRGTPRSAAICRGPARRRSARAAPRRGARAPSGASRMSSSSRAADQRRRRARAAASAAAAGAHDAVELRLFGHAFQFMLALVLGDEQARDLPVHAARDPYFSGRGGALHPRGDVGRLAVHLA